MQLARMQESLRARTAAQGGPELLDDVQSQHYMEQQSATLMVTVLEACGMQPRKGTGPFSCLAGTTCSCMPLCSVLQRNKRGQWLLYNCICDRYLKSVTHASKQVSLSRDGTLQHCKQATTRTLQYLGETHAWCKPAMPAICVMPEAS